MENNINNIYSTIEIYVHIFIINNNTNYIN